MFVSSAAVIFKGIEIGDKIFEKWLISLILTILTSVFITQTLIVNKFYFINFSIKN